MSFWYCCEQIVESFIQTSEKPIYIRLFGMDFVHICTRLYRLIIVQRTTVPDVTHNEFCVDVAP